MEEVLRTTKLTRDRDSDPVLAADEVAEGGLTLDADEEPPLVLLRPRLVDVPPPVDPVDEPP